MVILEFIGLLLIVVGAAILLSYGSEIFTEKYGANFTGSIILALITSLPEYMFVIWACVKLKYSMAVGSAVGAATLLTTLGFGSVILFATTRISKKPVKVIELTKETRTDAIYLFVTATVAFILAWIGKGFGIFNGIILILLFCGYVYHMARHAIKFSKGDRVSIPKNKFIKGIIFLIVGAVIIIFISDLFVDAMINLAKFLNVSPVTIAIILGPLASEMPEKITAWVTVIRNGKLAQISVSNFLGSIVNHNSLLLGTIPIIAFLQGQGKVANIITYPFMVMTVLTVFASLSVARRRLSRIQGVIFLLLYIVVIWFAFHISSP